MGAVFMFMRKYNQFKPKKCPERHITKGYRAHMINFDLEY